jgi:hypothetical protein
VRDQLTLADGRLLRRRSVRAHLRTCDGCREYAVSVRRRAGQPARAAAFGAWSPLAGCEMLQSVFRAAADAGGAAIAQGGATLFGPLALKAVAVSAVVATGLGAADVATMRPDRSRASGASDMAAQAVGARTAGSKAAASTGAATSARVTVVPAVFRTTATVTVALDTSRRRTAASTSKKPASRTVAADPAAPRGTARHHSSLPPTAEPARARADCNNHPSSAAREARPADGGGNRPARNDAPSDAGTTRNVAFTGDPAGHPQQHTADAAPAPAPVPADAAR